MLGNFRVMVSLQIRSPSYFQSYTGAITADESGIKNNQSEE